MICVDAPIASLVLNQNGTKEERKKKRNNRVKNSGFAYVCTRPYVFTYETNDKRYSLYWI